MINEESNLLQRKNYTKRNGRIREKFDTYIK